MASLAQLPAEAHHSGIREIGNEALRTPGAIRLDVGQPNFPTPKHISEAGKRAIDENKTFYTHTQGLISLRETIVGKLQRVNGIAATPDRIACYDQISLDGGWPSPASIAPDDPRIASVFTFSKSYSMTGWRIGYVTGSGELIDTATKVLESNSSCVSTISQFAAEAALDGPQDCVGEIGAADRQRRDVSVDIRREAEK